MKNNSLTKKNNKQMDFPLFITIIVLLCIGLVMMASASSYYSLNETGNSNYLLTRQMIFAVIGVVVMLVLSNIDYSVYKKWSYLAYVLGILLMIAVLFIGVERNGAKRWLDLGISTFQPSEYMKIALVMAISTYIAKNYKKINGIKGYIVPFIFLILVMIIMFLQNHLSGTVIMLVAAASIIFVSGIKVKFRYIVIGIAVIGGILATYFLSTSSSDGTSFRIKRIIAFMNPEDDITGSNWQAAQSLYAIGSGGIFGRGLGQSRQKYLWLPEAQNDFIFSVLGEELGLVGSLGVLAIFTFFIYRGYLIAMKCKDIYGSLLATGITSVFALQILVNIAVVTCSMPVTGMPLPFFSYGGTALFINLCAMGILLNISKNTK